MSVQNTAQDISDQVIAIVDENLALEGPLLPILNAVQAHFGYVPEAALPIIATKLNVSRAEVHGMVTFYHDYREAPAGRHVLKICRAEACQAMGGDRLAERVRQDLGVDWHETAGDRTVTLEPVYCLGLCACAPAAMLDGRVVGRLDETRMDDLVQQVRS